MAPNVRANAPGPPDRGRAAAAQLSPASLSAAPFDSDDDADDDDSAFVRVVVSVHDKSISTLSENTSSSVPGKVAYSCTRCLPGAIGLLKTSSPGPQ
jgi:hypothetical protein